MFFFALFGIQDKVKYIGTNNNVVCPSCGKFAKYEIHKSYMYFHVFFIPIFRWNVKYFVKTSCCGSFYELDPAVGKEFEKNPGTEIKPENLRRVDDYLPNKHCPNCKTDVPADFKYCPYCGGEL
ncbi:MAG TPA: zinc ribbon domain-containing protein [Clostridia bacterium]|nr:zinc ribbon domain-containing protein [Clostridia bacterium]